MKKLKKARSERNGPRPRTPKRELRTELFPAIEHFTVAGFVVGDVCFACECRVVGIGGEGGMMLAWCECALPEDHHEMEILSVF